MCGSPKPPDPVATAQAQAQYNTQAAKDAAALNAVDQYGPFGSTTFQRNPDGTPKSQTSNLSPQVQEWLDSQFGASTSLQNAAQKQLGYLPQDKFQLPNSPDATGYATEAFGADILDPSKFSNTDAIANTSYEQAKSRFQPDIDAARKQQEIKLKQRGINPGDEIYNDEMDRMERSANNAYSDASRQATLDAGNEQTRRANTALTARNYGSNTYQTNLSNELLERNQPYAEAAALLGTSPQFQTPSFMQTSAQGIAAPDYSGLVNANYAQKMANNNSIWNTVGQIGGAVAAPVGKALAGSSIFSDEDMKEDRKSADGEGILAMFRDMPVDDYRYKGEARAAFDVPERRTGTMAQDYAEHFGGDGTTIDLGDAVGKLMAAVKALDKRTADRRAA
jgi:hypothetical protein